MRKRALIPLILFIFTLLLAGCNIRTVEEMYCVPQRSETYLGLQSAIAGSMNGLTYSAPLTGEYLQPIQEVDLDGEGTPEYLVFAKGNSDKPLQILIFSESEGQFRLIGSIESSGTAFDQVEYIQMDGKRGLEIVVSRRVSDQVIRSLAVYTMVDGQIEQILATQCTKFVCCDLNGSRKSDLLVLRPGETDGENGIAELYSVSGGVVSRSTQANMSQPVSQIRRIIIGRLNDRVPAVYVAENVDVNSIITDVFAVVNGVFCNVSLSAESGTSVQTLRNYYVYAEDIDSDGVVELPALIPMDRPDGTLPQDTQHLIRWYAMASDGSVIDKMYTYHNFVGGWYIRVNSGHVPGLTVIQQGNSYDFSMWNPELEAPEKLFTIYALTGQMREEQAAINNRFVLYRTESTTFAADLEVVSASYGISKDDLIDGFRLIQEKWKIGET